MLNKNVMITVVNKFGGTVGYNVPDLGVHRNFYPNESKEISFEELQKLSYAPGGDVILKEFLEIKDKEAIAELFHSEPEPEYFYSKEDIIKIMTTGSLDQFLDCLDFAPESILETIKGVAVDLPLNDVAKRDAIRDKLGFDVARAIEIKNTKFDGGDEDSSGEYGRLNSKRRAAPLSGNPTPTGRRYQPAKKTTESEE